MLRPKCIDQLRINSYCQRKPHANCTNLHSAEVTVCCGANRIGIVGQYFGEEGRVRVTVYLESYVNVFMSIDNFLCQTCGNKMAVKWLNGDVTTAHTASESITTFQKCFLK